MNNPFCSGPNPPHHMPPFPHDRFGNRPWECMGRPHNRVLKMGLQRRLFFSFGVAIIMSGLAVLLVAHFFSSSGKGWHQQMEGARVFVTAQLARVWDKPAERDVMLRDLADNVGLQVCLFDTQGNSIFMTNEDCTYKKNYVLPVVRGSEVLGEAKICISSRFATEPWVFPLALFSVGAVLWLIAGKFARRMSRPLSELARVADDIGMGNLSSRVQLRHGRGEAGILADAINHMADRIEQQISDQRELLAAVSHELRTPLARLRLLTEIGRGVPAPDPKLFDDIDQEIIEIDSLVGDLLAKSRLDFASFSPKPLEAEAMAERALERAGLPIELLSVEQPGLIVDGDATLLARALANLIENARKHGGGLTRMRVVQRGAVVAFEAEDKGPGLTPGQEDSLFEAFYQGESNDRSGLGLGLALVKRIADAHQGRAFAQNLPRGGACVGIEIPVSVA
jgi:two-component system OmpR family sensor kinase